MGKIKKGIMFSLITVFIVISLITIVSIQKSLVLHSRKQMSIATRIKDMNNMHSGIMRDLGKVIKITTKRAVSAAINHTVSKREGLDQANETLVELIFDGTLDGDPQALMEDTVISDWTDKMMQIGILKGYDVDIGLDRNNFTIKPYDSWNLIAEGYLQINITDQHGIASIRRETVINEMISIINLEDPIYPLNTMGRGKSIFIRSPHSENHTKLLVSGDGSTSWVNGVSVLINKTNPGAANLVTNPGEKILVTDDVGPFASATVNKFNGLVSEEDISTGITIKYVVNATGAMDLIPNSTEILLDCENNNVWAIQNLIEDTENKYYHSSTDGASFLDRLEGELFVQDKYKIAANPIGLESFVDKDYLSRLDIPVRDSQTNIDYLYFSNDPSIVVDGVKGLDEDFRIDNETSLSSSHHIIYGVSQLLT